MTEIKGKGRTTAEKANVKVAKAGKDDLHTSSSAQAELGKKVGRSKK